MWAAFNMISNVSAWSWFSFSWVRFLFVSRVLHIINIRFTRVFSFRPHMLFFLFHPHMYLQETCQIMQERGSWKLKCIWICIRRIVRLLNLFWSLWKGLQQMNIQVNNALQHFFTQCFFEIDFVTQKATHFFTGATTSLPYFGIIPFHRFSKFDFTGFWWKVSRIPAGPYAISHRAHVIIPYAK